MFIDNIRTFLEYIKIFLLEIQFKFVLLFALRPCLNIFHSLELLTPVSALFSENLCITINLRHMSLRNESICPFAQFAPTFETHLPTNGYFSKRLRQFANRSVADTHTFRPNSIVPSSGEGKGDCLGLLIGESLRKGRFDKTHLLFWILDSRRKLAWQVAKGRNNTIWQGFSGCFYIIQILSGTWYE